MPEKKVNVNAGHRGRMRSRYLANGFEGFQDHEILELLLFYALPRRDTNKIAHELIIRFHSLSGVFDADINDLKQVEGVAEGAAVFLKMMPDVFKAYEMSKVDNRKCFYRSKELKTYLKNLYINEVVEKVYVICLDTKDRVICAEPIQRGTTREVIFEPRDVVEAAIRNRSDTIIIVHNHPDGNELPSNEDIYTTDYLKTALRGLKIELRDHYIVGNTVTSMRQCGYIND